MMALEMTASDSIIQLVDRVLNPYGFKRRKNTWYLDAPEIIAVVDLQKSRWGQQFFINLAFYLKSLGSERFPKENHCHARVRLSALLDTAERAKFDQALDLEDTSFSQSQREEVIETALRRSGLPLLQAGRSLDALRTFLTEREVPSLFLAKEARSALANQSS